MKLDLLVSLGIVGFLGSFFVFSGWPPYAEKRDLEAVEIEMVQGAAQFYEYRQSLLSDEIRRLEQQKREMIKNATERREWFKYFEKDLQKLYERRDKNNKVINRYEKRLSPRGR